MARDDGPAAEVPAAALLDPQARLLGEVNEAMVGLLRERVAAADADPLVIELTTYGGDAEMGRLLAQEVRELRGQGRRVLFLGRTIVYSAGVTMMAAVPAADRYLTGDCMLLVHCRQMGEDLRLSGPLEACALVVRQQLGKIEMGRKLEREGFAELVEGSQVPVEEIDRRAQTGWYIGAREALERGLVAGLL